MNDIVSDVNKSKRRLLLYVAMADRTHRDCLAGDKLQNDVRRWFSDSWANYNVARKSRHTGTGAWFVQGDTFFEWKWSRPNSLLWIHGRRLLLPVLTLL